jgi:homoserine O-acetyltransferase/O-succinyltransferase
METFIYKHNDDFKLESGEIFPGIEIAYTTIGKINREKTNVIWICHAFTANSNPLEWWPDMVGPGKVFDTAKYFIVCANVLGSCYGTTGPLSINPKTGKPWFRSFPEITVRDMVRAHQLVAAHLGLKKVHTITGGSVGGHQALEWSVMETSRFEHLILIATNARFSPWGIAFSASQRMAIEADQTYFDDKPDGGLNGLKAARSIALLSYRNAKAYNLTQKENDDQVYTDFKAESYQRYQGEKLARRFNAYSYIILSKALDGHNVARGRKALHHALSSIKAKTLVVGIDSDILFPSDEQKELSLHIPGSRLEIIASDFGHDGFLVEHQKITNIIQNFYHSIRNGSEIVSKPIYAQ